MSSTRSIPSDLTDTTESTDVWELFDVTQKPLYENPALIRRLHVHELLEQKESAKLLGCSRGTLVRRLEEFDIKRPWRNEDVLWELYWDKYFSTREIAELVSCGASTVKRRLKAYHIPRRKSNRDYNHAPYEVDVRGYEQWRTYDIDSQVVYRVHRLLGVSEYGIDALKGMVVHHKNEIKWDNRPENIELMTNSEHSKLHGSK